VKAQSVAWLTDSSILMGEMGDGRAGVASKHSRFGMSQTNVFGDRRAILFVSPPDDRSIDIVD